ncbi:hypothetical protein [Campylobacter sp. RM5004]|nr:hypothetical protein [Campylobacter sp. RM5004]
MRFSLIEDKFSINHYDDGRCPTCGFLYDIHGKCECDGPDDDDYD